MRNLVATTLLASVFYSTIAPAEPTYIEKMTGFPASCSLDAMFEETKVWDAAKKYGEGSKRWSEAFHKRLDVVRTCVDGAKDNGKGLYKAEVARLPPLKSELSDMYVAWLGYLDHLIDDDRDSYREMYELAANRLKAQTDAM